MTLIDTLLHPDSANAHSVDENGSAGLFFYTGLVNRAPVGAAGAQYVPLPLALHEVQAPFRQGQLDFGVGDNDDPLVQARKARDRYEATMPSLRSYADFVLYWHVIAALGLTGETSIYLREHLRLFLEPMGRPTRAEVVGIVPMPRAVAIECVRLMRIEGGYARRVASRALYNASAFGREDLRGALPAALRNLPGTWLCIEHGDDFAAVPSAIILRLTMIRSSRLRTAAILEVLLLSAEGTRAGLDVPTAAFERWDDAFAEAGLSADRSDHWFEVAKRYCITRDLQATHAIGPRISAFERWGAAEYRRSSYERDNKTLAKPLQKARLPVLPTGKAAKQFLRDFNKVRDKYGIDCTKHRKVDADNLSNNFAARLAAAQLRARQAVRLWREAEAGAEALRSSPGLDRLFFSWKDDVLSLLGLRRRQLQTIRMEAIYRDVLEEELTAGSAQPQFRFVEDELASVSTETNQKPADEGKSVTVIDDVSPNAADGVSELPREIVFRLVEVVSCDSAATVPPWWARLSGSGVLVGPCGLQIELRETRRAAMVQLKVSAVRKGPSGLVGPDGPAEARLHQRALNAGIVLVAAESFGHAMAIGAVAMRTLALTFARVGELLQMVRRTGKDAWQHIDVEGRGKRPAWMAFAKGSYTRTPFIIYDQRTLPLITTLHKMRLLREHSREAAVVTPWRALARKVDPDRYVFAFRGRMLDPDDLNYIYQVLMAGIQRIRNHDLRHSAANRSAREGHVTEADVAFRLKHAGAAAALPTRLSGRFRLAGDYARDTASQRDSDGKAYCDARLAFERLLGVPLSGDLM